MRVILDAEDGVTGGGDFVSTARRRPGVRRCDIYAYSRRKTAE